MGDCLKRERVRNERFRSDNHAAYILFFFFIFDEVSASYGKSSY